MTQTEPKTTGLTQRLHISPFNQAILTQILPGSKQSLATSISFHCTQSDPDRGFGYIELLTEEADRLRNKFNGLTLRGYKMSIEKANPEKRKRIQEAEDKTEPPSKKKTKTKTKKLPKNKDEIPGVELNADRKVKRGWTDAKAGRSGKESHRERSKYTNKDELLFRSGKDKAVTKIKSKDKSDTKADKSSKTGKSKGNIIHEFETTTKFPAFLKQAHTSRKGAPPTFVDGQGWVDENGDVVEAVKTRRKPTMTPKQARADDAVDSPLKIQGLPKQTSVAVEQEHSKSEADSSSSASLSSEFETSSGSESDSGDASDEENERESVDSKHSNTPKATVKAFTAHEESAHPVAQSTEAQTPRPTADTATQAVHPLEALYKRRPEDVPRPAPIRTSFSFFGGAEDEAEQQEDLEQVGGSSAIVPQTPFTQSDQRFRRSRSAAPTPDTAVASRRFFEDSEDDDEEAQADETEETRDGGVEQTSDTANESKDSHKGRSAMVKEFYERRSELNQSWKLRRRESAKQLRQRENRRLTRRAL